MPSAPAAPAVVLEYSAAPAPPSQALRALSGLLTVLFCVVVCGAFAWMVQPDSYRAAGFLRVTSHTSVNDLFLDGTEVGGQHMPHLVAMWIKSPSALAEVSHSLGGIVTPAQLATKLEARPIPDTELVAIRFADADPRVAAATVNVAMRRLRVSGVTTVAPATVPTQRVREEMAAVAGPAAGLLIGLAIVALRWK